MPRPECPLAHMACVDSLDISFHVFHDLKITFLGEVFCLSACCLDKYIYDFFMTFYLFIIIIIISFTNKYLYLCMYVFMKYK